MATITISDSRDTATRLKELAANLAIAEKCSDGEGIEFEKIGHASSLALLPLIMIIAEKKLKPVHTVPKQMGFFLESVTEPSSANDYFAENSDDEYFLSGKIDLMKRIPSLPALIDTAMQKYEAALLRDVFVDDDHRNNLEQALRLFIGEVTANLQDHANANRFWIMASMQKSTGDIELCFVDDGVGIPGSYKNKVAFADDIDAIRKAMQGFSSKPDPRGTFTERGYGLRKSASLITQSDIRGEFVLISGGAGFLARCGEDPVAFTLDEARWQGTIVMGHFRKPASRIDVYRYIE